MLCKLPRKFVMSKITRDTIKTWTEHALKNLGGTSHYKSVAKELWKLYGIKLKGDERFYTWQYDMRWAAQELRDEGKLNNSHTADIPKGYWSLTEKE